MDAPVTSLEAAVLTLFGVFMKHQKDEQISKDEFKNMMKEQLPHFFKCEDIETIFQKVDLNSDGFMNFNEFALLVLELSCCSYAVLQELLEQQKSQ